MKRIRSFITNCPRAYRVFIYTTIVFVTLAGLVVIYFITYPNCSASWEQVKTGLTRDQVYSRIGLPHDDLYDLKGFELYSKDYGGFGWWQLFVHHDSPSKESKVTEYWIAFTDPNNGLRNINEQNPGRDFFASYSDE